MIKPNIHQPVARRIIPASPIKASRRTDFNHAGARVTIARRGPLHRAARRITS